MEAFDTSNLNSYDPSTSYNENGFSKKSIIDPTCDTFDVIDDQIVIKACMAGNSRVVQRFLERGHDVNEFLITGWNLLMYAASYAQPNVIQYLLNIGANPNLHQEGYTALMALCYSTKGSPEKRLKCLKYLIEAQANVNTANKLKETPLMLACRMQETDFIVELLKYVDHINYADSDQRTALFYAVGNNRYDVVELLIKNGADKAWRNYRELTPYDVALAKGYDKLFPLLHISDNEDELDVIETSHTSSWLDVFPTDNGITTDAIDNDILSILTGMGLDGYKACFRGISLKRFLQLQEEDLERMGIDIGVHREKFINELFRFHKREWSNNVLNVDKTKPFKPFDAMKILGNINKQLTVMSSSVYFSQNYFDTLEENEADLSEQDKEILKNELMEVQIMAEQIKEATERINNLSQIIKEENPELSLPTYIEKKKKNRNHKWIVLTIATLASIYLLKRRFWNGENSSRRWRDTFNFSIFNGLYDKICLIGLFLKSY